MSAVAEIRQSEPLPEVKVTAVPPVGCPQMWPLVRSMLEPAVRRSGGRWTMEALYMALCMGHQNLWVAYVDDETRRPLAAMTTMIAEYPNSTMLAVQFLGGEEIQEWFGLMVDTLDRYARDCGCAGVEAVARHGFWPWMKKGGYQKVNTVYERLFEGGQ